MTQDAPRIGCWTVDVSGVIDWPTLVIALNRDLRIPPGTVSSRKQFREHLYLQLETRPGGWVYGIVLAGWSDFAGSCPLVSQEFLKDIADSFDEIGEFPRVFVGFR